MARTQLNLTHEERSRLKKLIRNQQLTESLDLLRRAAHRQLLHRQARISEEMLTEYLATWQRILCVSETSENEQQLSDTA